jgi:hypothetical protein
VPPGEVARLRTLRDRLRYLWAADQRWKQRARTAEQALAAERAKTCATCGHSSVGVRNLCRTFWESRVKATWCSCWEARPSDPDAADSPPRRYEQADGTRVTDGTMTR